jgi:hypothetical protein
MKANSFRTEPTSVAPGFAPRLSASLSRAPSRICLSPAVPALVAKAGDRRDRACQISAPPARSLDDRPHVAAWKKKIRSPDRKTTDRDHDESGHGVGQPR